MLIVENILSTLIDSKEPDYTAGVVWNVSMDASVLYFCHLNVSSVDSLYHESKMIKASVTCEEGYFHSTLSCIFTNTLTLGVEGTNLAAGAQPYSPLDEWILVWMENCWGRAGGKRGRKQGWEVGEETEMRVNRISMKREPENKL